MRARRQVGGWSSLLVGHLLNFWTRNNASGWSVKNTEVTRIGHMLEDTVKKAVSET